MNMEIPPDRTGSRTRAVRLTRPENGNAGSILQVDLVGKLRHLEIPEEFANLARTAGERKNLSAKTKAVFFIGRGKTGKTTTARFLAERWAGSGKAFALLDADRTNAVLHQYFDAVEHPPFADDASVAAWITDTVLETIADRTNILIDLGGGDTTLAHLIETVPGFVGEAESCGGAVIACCTLGSEQDDLMPIAKLDTMGFRPTATALLLHQAGLKIPLNNNSFTAIHNAAPILVPVLQAAAAVENRRMTYQDARDGISEPGMTPIGPFLRLAIRDWMLKMAAALEPIQSWLE